MIISTINPLEYKRFSGGEVHVSNVHTYGYKGEVTFVLKDYSMDGFMALAQKMQIYRRKVSNGYMQLVIPYLPYARQDRWIEDGEPFSLKIYCQLINDLCFDKITVFDPHSDVGPALLNNCHVVKQSTIFKQVVQNYSEKDWLYVAPDAGSYKKVSELCNNPIIGTKIRGAGGKITACGVANTDGIEGRDCIIVDDICDGGATFIGLASCLRTLGAKDIYLYVTHGIFSKGFYDLAKYFTNIYTTDSICTRGDPLLIKKDINYASY